MWLPPSRHLSHSVGWQPIDSKLLLHLVRWSGTSLPSRNPKSYLEGWDNKTDHRSQPGRLPGCRALKAAEGCRIKGLSPSRPRRIRPDLRPTPSTPWNYFLPSRQQWLGGTRGLLCISPLATTRTRLGKRGRMGRYNAGLANVLPVIVQMYSGGAVSVHVCACVSARRGCSFQVNIRDIDTEDKTLLNKPVWVTITLLLDIPAHVQ